MRGRLRPVHRETALVGKAVLKCGSARNQGNKT